MHASASTEVTADCYETGAAALLVHTVCYNYASSGSDNASHTCAINVCVHTAAAAPACAAACGTTNSTDNANAFTFASVVLLLTVRILLMQHSAIDAAVTAVAAAAVADRGDTAVLNVRLQFTQLLLLQLHTVLCAVYQQSTLSDTLHCSSIQLHSVCSA
jgi:hypothetical protein